MTAGSVFGVPALLAVVAALSYWFFVASWILAGFAMSAEFYALGPGLGKDSVRALTALTLWRAWAARRNRPQPPPMTLTSVLTDIESARKRTLVNG
jgi:hypothetical protein